MLTLSKSNKPITVYIIGTTAEEVKKHTSAKVTKTICIGGKGGTALRLSMNAREEAVSLAWTLLDKTAASSITII